MNRRQTGRITEESFIIKMNRRKIKKIKELRRNPLLYKLLTTLQA